MINAAPYIRTAFNDLLGNVMYESAAVPMTENDSNSSFKRRLVLGETSSGDRSTKDSFARAWSQVVEVICEQHTAKREHVDKIGDIVMNLIQPTPKTTSLIIDNRFQLSDVKIDGHNYLTDDGGSGIKIVRLILRYSFLINQINV